MLDELPTPLAKAHWVVRDPRPHDLSATRAWSELVLEHLPCYDLIELVNAVVVLTREVQHELFRHALDEIGREARDALEQHETWRDSPLELRPVSLAEQRLLAAVHGHGATIDGGIALLGSRLAALPRSRAGALAPSDRLYPATLVDRLTAAPLSSARANPHLHAIAERVAAAEPDGWREVIAALSAIAPTRASQRWPDPELARSSAAALEVIEPSWDREALWVCERARRARPRLSSSQRRDLAQAMRWCTSARQLMVRLGGALGWLRLLCDYLMEIRRGAERIIDEARADAPTSTFIDVVMHEIAHALGVLDGDPSTAARALTDREVGGEAARMRLSRGRERCLERWHLHEPEGGWDDDDFGALLAELATLIDRHGDDA